MVQMVWDAPMPDPAPDFAMTRLGAAHAPAMVELVALTNPGPFGPRTFELGDYFGIFEGARLVAMAGERMRADRLHEISAVCTRPEYQGRGLARTLMETLLRRQMQRGELPFLHVMLRQPWRAPPLRAHGLSPVPGNDRARGVVLTARGARGCVGVLRARVERGRLRDARQPESGANRHAARADLWTAVRSQWTGQFAGLGILRCARVQPGSGAARRRVHGLAAATGGQLRRLRDEREHPR